MKKPAVVIAPIGRRVLVFSLTIAMGGALVLRAVDLHVHNHDLLQTRGAAFQHRILPIPSHRGVLFDRNGEPLAISTPVDTLWAEPRKLSQSPHIGKLARALEIPTDELRKKLDSHRRREFVHLRRHVDPSMSEAVMGLKVEGVHVRREYRRYYPLGEVAAHLLGYTDIDDKGQEGLELAYDTWLAGRPGVHRVIRDRLGRAIEDIESIRPASPGKDLTLSIDKHLQHVAHRELHLAVQKHRARAASAIVLDVRSGEVLAMVNQPTYNPNRRSDRGGPRLRNRAVTDVLEPGSTMKPITLAAALESGDYQPDVVVETAPGYYRIGRHLVSDHQNYGSLDLAGIVQKSSNVGASKIALSLNPQQLWSVFDSFGFGRSTGSGFPGEAVGTLNHSSQWSRIERATLSFGYGLSVTPLQLARAYSAIATDGILPDVSFLKVHNPVRGRQVIDVETARQLRGMLEMVTRSGGTGTLGKVLGYRVAGKTGTSRKLQGGGYSDDHYIALFAGFAPLSLPQVVVVVVVDEPSAGQFYGGLVAAPVFSKIMSSALRLRGTPPDDWRPHAGQSSGIEHARSAG